MMMKSMKTKKIADKIITVGYWICMSIYAVVFLIILIGIST
jgi:hypothetical protein